MKPLAALSLALLTALSAAADGVAWEKTYAEAKTKAGLEGRLLYLDFYTDW